MIFGDITTGPSSDLQGATNIARAMVTRWGMSDVLGPVAYEGNGGRTQFNEPVENEHSEDISKKIDSEISKIINNGLKTAEGVLEEHKKAFAAIANKLIEVETLEMDEYEKIIIAHGIMPKKREEKVKEIA